MPPRLRQLPHRRSEAAQWRQLHHVAVAQHLHADRLHPHGEAAQGQAHLGDRPSGGLGEFGEHGLADRCQAGAQRGHQFFGDLPHLPLPGLAGQRLGDAERFPNPPPAAHRGWRLPRSISDRRGT